MGEGPRRKEDRCLGGPGEIDVDLDTDAPLDGDGTAAAVIRRTMLQVIERENRGLSGVSQKTYLTLSLAGPELPNLDLMDLPGLVTVQRPTEPDTMIADTKALVDAAIRETRGHAIYLVCRAATEDPKLSPVIEVMSQHGHDIVDWTLGVVTKCDDAGRKKLKKSLNAEELTEVKISDGNGWVATMNAPLEDEALAELRAAHPGGVPSSAYFAAKAREEALYFDEEGMSDRVKQGRATTDALIGRLSTLYRKYLTQEWAPRTLRMLRDYERRARRQAGRPGTSPAHDEVAAAAAVAATPGLAEAVSAAAVELLDASGQGLLNALARKAFKPLEARLMAKLQAECSGKAHPLVRAHTLLPELEEMAREVAKRVHDEGQRAVRDALEADRSGRTALGSKGATAVRVGRFPSFIDAVVAEVQASSAARAAEFEARVVGALREKYEEFVRPVYDLDRMQVKLMMRRPDRKILADALTYILCAEATAVGKGVKPAIQAAATAVSSMSTEGASVPASAAAAWVESPECAAERLRLMEMKARITQIVANVETLMESYGTPGALEAAAAAAAADVGLQVDDADAATESGLVPGAEALSSPAGETKVGADGVTPGTNSVGALVSSDHGDKNQDDAAADSDDGDADEDGAEFQLNASPETAAVLSTQVYTMTPEQKQNFVDRHGISQMFRSIMTGSQDEAAVQILCCGALEELAKTSGNVAKSVARCGVASLALRAAMQHADDPKSS